MIRHATLTDCPAIVRMVGAFLAGTRYGELFAFNPDRLALLVDGVIDDLGVILLAEVDQVGSNLDSPCPPSPEPRAPSQIVGMLAATALPDPYSGQRIAEELAWWVEPRYRTGSVGPKLLRAFEQWARDRGIGVVKMVAPTDSTVGGYYERMGYEAVEVSYVKRLT